MKHLAFVSILFLTACQSASVSSTVENNSPQTPPADALFTTDSEQNVVRKGGWFSNDFRRGKMLRHKTQPMLTGDGRNITVIREDFDYPNGLIVQDALPGQVPQAGKAMWGSEIRGSLSRQPYCIFVILHRASPPPPNPDNSFHDHGMAATYCDADGDGIFETRTSPTFRTPNWVK